jgi:hypothetical protein
MAKKCKHDWEHKKHDFLPIVFKVCKKCGRKVQG